MFINCIRCSLVALTFALVTTAAPLAHAQPCGLAGLVILDDDVPTNAQIEIRDASRQNPRRLSVDPTSGAYQTAGADQGFTGLNIVTLHVAGQRVGETSYAWCPSLATNLSFNASEPWNRSNVNFIFRSVALPDASSPAYYDPQSGFACTLRGRVSQGGTPARNGSVVQCKAQGSIEIATPALDGKYECRMLETSSSIAVRLNAGNTTVTCACEDSEAQCDANFP